MPDAEAAISAGAAALGFVFWPKSPRHVSVAIAQRIVAAMLPSVSAVGVFVDQPAEEVNEIAERVGLNFVQLHGSESVQYVESMKRPVIKALAVGGDVPPVPRQWPGSVRILLDVHDPVRRGGTGRIIDWVAASGIAEERDVILAGGLTPDNVGHAIASVRPWGIDVSSGVEAAPGIKDHARLRALFEAVHGSGIAARS